MCRTEVFALGMLKNGSHGMNKCEAYNTKTDKFCNSRKVAAEAFIERDDFDITVRVCRGHAIWYAKHGWTVKYLPAPKIPRWLARNADFRWLQKNTDDISLWSNTALQSEEPYNKGRYGASALVGGKRIEVSCSEDIAVAMQMLVKLLYSKEWA